MEEKTNGVVIVDHFVITGASAEAVEAVSALFTWDKQALIEELVDMYDPDDDEEFSIRVIAENPDNRPFISVSVVIDPKDILNLDDIDPYEWTPVEAFIKLCNKKCMYGYKDTLFAQWGCKPSGDITGDNLQYALGFFACDVEDEGRVYYPIIKASIDSNFKPTYCKLIEY